MSLCLSWDFKMLPLSFVSEQNSRHMWVGFLFSNVLIFPLPACIMIWHWNTTVSFYQSVWFLDRTKKNHLMQPICENSSQGMLCRNLLYITKQAASPTNVLLLKSFCKQYRRVLFRFHNKKKVKAIIFLFVLIGW